MTYLTLFNYNNENITVREEDGYFNATQMCKAMGKRWTHFMENKSTQVLIEEQKVETGINTLIKTELTGCNENRATWVHPVLLPYFKEWLNRTKLPTNGKKKMEKHYRDDLAELLDGETEIPTIAGIIDIFTSFEIIEVKEINNWKAALGQVLVYSLYYPSHQKRIHLFGNTDSSYLDMVKEHCSKFHVVVTWEI